MIERLRLWLHEQRVKRYRQRMHAMRVMYPPEGYSPRWLAPKPRTIVREFGPRPR